MALHPLFIRGWKQLSAYKQLIIDQLSIVGIAENNSKFNTQNSKLRLAHSSK